MDIFQILTKNHEAIKTLLAELVSLSETDVSRRDELLAQIQEAFVPHARVKEAVFYNMLRLLDVSKKFILHGYAEHAEALGLLQSLRTVIRYEASWKRTAEKLNKSVRQHIEAEENKLFPAAQTVLTLDEALAMAAAYEKLKSEIQQGRSPNFMAGVLVKMMPERISSRFRRDPPLISAEAGLAAP
jgi:hemerythrin-like domain-containing protein